MDTSSMLICTRPHLPRDDGLMGHTDWRPARGRHWRSQTMHRLDAVSHWRWHIVFATEAALSAGN